MGDLARPRGDIDVFYTTRCGWCQHRSLPSVSRKEARDSAWASGWKRSTALGWLCPRCDQARHPL